MDMMEIPAPDMQTYRTLTVHEINKGRRMERADCVAEEVAVAIEFNGISQAVMMATPADLEDLACGFSLTEGIVDSLSQIYDYAWSCCAQGHTLHLTIAADCFMRLKEKRRNLTGRTGCGLCGTESLAQAMRAPAALPAGPCFAASAVARAVDAMRARQLLLAVTGATHAAAWCTNDGQIALMREDVGRHNALDKLIGALLRSDYAAGAGFITITSRASYEMVQKAATAGISLLAAVSGVTGLAVEMAQDAGLTLLGFTRGEQMNIYSHHERLILDPQ